MAAPCWERSGPRTAPLAAVRPLVSIIVPTYNAESYVGETLESALRQTYERTEVVVVDDGSTDGTVALVRRMDAGIRIVRQTNSGVCVARNHGAASAQGALLAFLDADDLWEPEKLERQVEVFQRHPEVGVVASDFDEIDGEGRKLSREMKQPRHLFNRVVDLHRQLLGFGNFLSVSASVTTRAAFEKVRGFHTTERILSGDYDLWIRISEHHRFFVLPEILCHYRVLPNSQIHGSFEKEYGAQRRILEMHRGRFTRRQYQRRLSRLYADWADSALDENGPGGWKAWRKALGYDPFNVEAWLLGTRILARRILRPSRPASAIGAK